MADQRSSDAALCTVEVEGFKAHFDSRRLDLRPLTVLAGPNSSGKSSLMQAVLLLKQTLDAMPLDTGGLKLDGPNVNFTSAEQFLSSEPGKGNTRREFRLSLGFDSSDEIGSTFRRSGHAVEVVATKYGVDRKYVQLRVGEDTPLALQSLLARRLPDAAPVQPQPPKRWGSFLVPFMGGGPINRTPSILLPPPLVWVHAALRSLIHIPALRGNPLRAFPRTVIGHDFPGIFTNLAPALLADWTRRKSGELKQVNTALAHLGLTWKAEAREQDAANIEVAVARTPQAARGRAQDLVNIADVGFGVSQVLPIVVALVVAQRNQIVYIEQPEIHLHPRAVMALADQIADAARRGVRCVIETHSDVLLRRFQWNIARSDRPLAHEQVIFHWFFRNERGHSQLRSVTPDQGGAYGDWPVDFADVDAENARQYLVAADAHLPDEPDADGARPEGHGEGGEGSA